MGAGQLERQRSLLESGLHVPRSLQREVGIHALVDGRGAAPKPVEGTGTPGMGEGGERLERLPLGAPGTGREHLVHRVDLHVPRVHSRGADELLLPGRVEAQRLGIGLEEVDGRGAVEPEHVAGDALPERRGALELEPHLEALLERNTLRL